MRRIGLFLIGISALSPTPPAAARQASSSPSSATCEAGEINTVSYRLTTEAQAMNVLRPPEPWWEPYGIWKGPREIGNVNEGAARLAERALELDDTNLLAHGYLARQHVVMAVDAKKAEDAWTRVLDSDGAVVWTATLYEVDARSFFVVAFDRRSIRVFRFGQIAGPLRTHFGVPDFPGPARVDLWRALGGCLPAGLAPDAEIPWSAVREIRASNWTLRFALEDRVEISSDRGSRRNDDTLEINLHGQTGVTDFRFAMTPFARPPFYGRQFYGRPVGPDPAAYQLRVLQMLVTFFDPERRIRTPDLTIATLPSSGY